MDYGTCEKCGAPMAMSKRGTPYCSALCWKQGQPQRPTPQKADAMYYPGNQTQFVNKGGNLEVKKEPDWDNIRAEKADDIRDNVLIKEAGEHTRAMYVKGDITSEMMASAHLKMFNQLKEKFNEKEELL